MASNLTYMLGTIHVGSLYSASIHPSISAFSDPKYNLPVAKKAEKERKSCLEMKKTTKKKATHVGEESERENGGVCLLGISKLTVICWSLRSRAELCRIYFQILIHQMRITDEAVRRKKKTGPNLPV